MADNNKKDFRTPLKKAKGFGASGHGVSHWWAQRLTAIALAIVMPIFMVSLLTSMLSPNVGVVADWFGSPLASLVMIVMLVATFWHGMLGIQVIIEDYIKPPFKKFGMTIANYFIAIAFAVVGILAVIRMHLIDVTSLPM